MESLTTDSRPGSVMDEGESNSEPAESMILLSKDAEEKDPLSIALPETPSSDTQTKEDHDRENDQRSPSDVATPEDEADIPAQSSKTVGDDEKKLEIKGEKESKDVKDSEMLSKLANIKQESNSSMTDGEFQSKESSSSTASSSVLIKKEPSEEESNQNLNNQQQTQPADLKVKIEIKSEKNGSNSNSVPSDISNQMPNEQDNNNNAENLVCKPIEKLSAAVPSSSDNSSSSSQPLLSSKDTAENTTGTDYSMKTFMEHQQREGIKIEQNALKSEQNKSPEVKPHHPFGIVDREDGKMPPNEQQQQPPPGMLRHPYEPLMMKYDLPPHPAMDLKYLPPEHPARAFAENVALKSHFSADNLIKGSYPSDLNKYQQETQSQPMDVSRVTPNQDSQGSNSNSQPATLPSPSPLTSSAPSTVSSSHPSSIQPPPSSLFVSHPGLMSAHHHPSLLGGPPLSAASLVSTSSPFLPIPSGLPRPDPIPSTASRSSFSSSGLTTSSITSSISSAGSAFGPGGSSLYSRGNESNGRDGLPHRSSPLGPLLHGAPHPLLSHPLPLHLGHPGLAGIPPHHLPPHLHNHLMQPLGGPNTPLPLIGGPPPQGPSSNPLSSLIEAAGRRTPNSATSIGNHIGQSPQSQAPPSSHHNSITTSSAGNALNSSLSRSSPLVHPSPSGAFTHRPQSPSSNHPANLSRNSPLHLGAGQPVGPSPASISAERERQLLRQQSPHMTPPPPSSSASSLVASPLSKM